MDKREKICDQKICEQCKPCLRHDGQFCVPFLFPAAKWRVGTCPMFLSSEKKSVEVKKKGLNPIKASKWRGR